jgi:hypothetical protein
VLPSVSKEGLEELSDVCVTNNLDRLSDNNRAREALRHSLPEPLRDATFSSVLRDDAATKRCLAQLLINLSDNVNDPQNVGGGM